MGSNANSGAPRGREHLVDCPPDEIESLLSEQHPDDQLCVIVIRRFGDNRKS